MNSKQNDWSEEMTREEIGKLADIVIQNNRISKALEKQIPKKPLEQRYVNYEIENELIGHCPSCRIKWDVAFWQRHCSNCGQKLDWSEE